MKTWNEVLLSNEHNIQFYLLTKCAYMALN